jgi:hypothetical protein
VGNQAVVQWIQPITNGSPITAYLIYIREHNSTTFTQEFVSCDGSSPDVVAYTTCQIPLSVLIIPPYSLVKLESIYAKIIAINYYG